jgi:MFS family permease
VFAIGLGLMLTAASVNTVLQTIVPDALRARVASIYMMSFLGTSPIGALLAGAVAEKIGPPLTLAIGGSIALAAAMVYWRKLPAIRREIRPLYEQLGIAPTRPGQVGPQPPRE